MPKCEVSGCNTPAETTIDFTGDDEGDFCATHAMQVVQDELLKHDIDTVDLDE